MKIVVIGNGPAGFYAAKRIRTLSPESSVAVIDRDKLPIYTKLRLPDFIAGKVEEKKLFLAKPEDYEKSGIETHFGNTITSINTKEKKVITSSCEIFHYDKLIIATGAKAFRPTIRGVSEDGVYTLRTLADAKAIIEKTGISRKVAVIGGGLLGIELANALKSRGLKVDIIEFFPQLLPRQLNDIGASLLLKKLESPTFSFYLDRITTEIIRREDSLVLKTNRQDEIQADFVVISAGIKTETGLAENCGIKTEKGIVINNRLETSAPDIFAIGDCAQFDGRIFGLWMAAKEQGEALADILAGKRESYKPSPFNPMLKVNGISLDEIRKEAAGRKL
ncbi:MAG: FAD-dependent oxidoreductase [Victivallales bacterium]|jgi:nitrite reductase (NADH) large subunit